jgi:hypothetical protein
MTVGYQVHEYSQATATPSGSEPGFSTTVWKA